jgi:hypothetical protein
MKNLFSIFILSLVANFTTYPTYRKDIRPIFKNRCSSCHDKMGDKNWQIYENAFKYRYSIKQKTILKEMPPNQNISQSEREYIIKWVNTGAKNE